MSCFAARQRIGRPSDVACGRFSVIIVLNLLVIALNTPRSTLKCVITTDFSSVSRIVIVNVTLWSAVESSRNLL